MTSQSPYLEEFVGEPYVYTVDINNLSEVNETLKKILKKKVTATATTIEDFRFATTTQDIILRKLEYLQS